MNRREAIQRAALLLGAAVSSSGAASAMGQAAISPTQTGKPKYLSARDFGTVSALADRILPRTETPGALDVGVPEFVDVTFGEYLSEGERSNFQRGLTELAERCQAEFGKDYAALPSETQDALIVALAEESKGVRNAFLRKARELILLGYFTSEKVGKEVLRYDPIPGGYVGCIPVSEVGNVSWTE